VTEVWLPEQGSVEVEDGTVYHSQYIPLGDDTPRWREPKDCSFCRQVEWHWHLDWTYIPEGAKWTIVSNAGACNDCYQALVAGDDDTLLDRADHIPSDIYLRTYYSHARTALTGSRRR
jgi:hypothetical protein